jgi:hypothetical protein
LRPVQAKLALVSWALVAYTCNPSYLETEIRIKVQSQLRQIVEPILKIPNTKKDW